MKMYFGQLIIFSAPSGAGKTTIVKHLLTQDLNLEFSISATSNPGRHPRRQAHHRSRRRVADPPGAASRPRGPGGVPRGLARVGGKLVPGRRGLLQRQ